MKTVTLIIALFTLLAIACYMADKTGQSIYGFIQVATILGMGAVLVRKLKLV